MALSRYQRRYRGRYQPIGVCGGCELCPRAHQSLLLTSDRVGRLRRLQRRRSAMGAEQRVEHKSETAELPLVTLVVPMRNERENVGEFFLRTAAALEGQPWRTEIVVVDDSDDDTPAVVRELAPAAFTVRVLHRPKGERHGKLAGALANGIRARSGAVCAVIDADLQHPPEVLPALLAPLVQGEVDYALGTRYRREGSNVGLQTGWRRFASQGSNLVVRAVLPRLRKVSDPGSGLFGFRTEVVDGSDLRPIGFKMGVEVMVRGRWSRVGELPYNFEPRFGGLSNARLRDGLIFLRHIARLRFSTWHRGLPNVEIVELTAAPIEVRVEPRLVSTADASGADSRNAESLVDLTGGRRGRESIAHEYFE